MISIDKRVLKAISKLTSDYDQRIYYKAHSDRFVLVHNASEPEVSISPRVPPAEISASIHRLTSSGYIKSVGAYGGFYFVITPKLVHRRAFWLDDFSKKFWGGYFAGLISGILVTVIGGLILAFLQAALGI